MARQMEHVISFSSPQVPCRAGLGHLDLGYVPCKKCRQTYLKAVRACRAFEKVIIKCKKTHFFTHKIVYLSALSALNSLTYIKTHKKQGTWLFFTCPRPALNCPQVP